LPEPEHRALSSSERQVAVLHPFIGQRPISGFSALIEAEIYLTLA